MTLHTEYGSLSRDLTTEENALLKRHGQKGPPTPELKRLLAAMLTESQGLGSSDTLGLTQDEIEVIAYYATYPEEASKVLNRFPPRTQSCQLCSALLDHYLLRHDGRFKHNIFYTGPRRMVARS